MTAKNHEAYGVAQKALNLSPPRMGLLKSSPEKRGWGLNPTGEGGFTGRRGRKAVFRHPLRQAQGRLSIRPFRASSG